MMAQKRTCTRGVSFSLACPNGFPCVAVSSVALKSFRWDAAAGKRTRVSMCQSPLIVGPPWASPCRASVSPRGQVKSNQESTPFVLFPLTSQNQESVYGDLVRVRKIHIRHANSFYEDIRITGPCTGYFGPILLSRKRRRPRPNK